MIYGHSLLYVPGCQFFNIPFFHLTLDHDSFIIWFSIEYYCMQDLIFALYARLDLIFESAIQPTFSAMKQTELTCGRPYCKRAMLWTKITPEFPIWMCV